MNRTATIPAKLLARMAPATRARVVANATILEATAFATILLELETGRRGSGETTAQGMCDESGFDLAVCAEALTRLVDADQASSRVCCMGYTWFKALGEDA
jgi:hypothetical protein